jgi:hypothetical protein
MLAVALGIVEIGEVMGEIDLPIALGQSDPAG